MRAWLFTILRKVWLNQRQRRFSSPEIVLVGADEKVANLIVEPSNDRDTLYVGEPDVAAVRKAIEQLPGLFREAIVLREYEQLSYHEIASVMQCPLGTVMSRLERARSKLRILLASQGKFAP